MKDIIFADINLRGKKVTVECHKTRSRAKRSLRCFAKLVYSKTAPHLYSHGELLNAENSVNVYVSYVLLVNVMKEVAERVNALDTRRGTVAHRLANFQTEHMMRLVRRLCSSDVAQIVQCLKNALLLYRQLIGSPYYGTNTIPKNKMKQLIKDTGVPQEHWLSREYLIPFIRECLVVAQPDVDQAINTVLQFVIRLTLNDLDELTDAAVSDYVAAEEEYHQWSYDPEILAQLREIVHEQLKDFKFKSLGAVHGYGATAEVKRSQGTDAKYHSMVPTLESYYLAKKLSWWPQDHCWPGLTRQHYLMHHNMKKNLHYASVADLVGEVQFVAKGIDKKRTVSKEPTVNVFFQKILGKLFDEYFVDHPKMNISLHHQEHNRDLALYGSERGDYATIDLSAASDSVSNTLVKAIFPEEIYRALAWCRTQTVCIPGYIDRLSLEKFAPMGAATCFPVECIVFGAVVALAQRQHGVDHYYRIYGDDIVVHKSMYHAVMELLEKLHFKPNTDKSYGDGSRFTESCGIECSHGYDVSPIRLSRKINFYKGFSCGFRGMAKYADITQLSAFISLTNDLYTAKFYKTWRGMQECVLAIWPHTAFSNIIGCGMYDPDALTKNNHLEMSWDTDHQQIVYRHKVLSSTLARGPEESRYSKQLEDYMNSSRDMITPETELISKVGAAHTTMKYVWTPRELLCPFKPLERVSDETGLGVGYSPNVDRRLTNIVASTLST